MKKYIIILIVLLLSSKLYSQQNEFVRLDGKKFMLGCDEFYPKFVNFCIGAVTNPQTKDKYLSAYDGFRNEPFYGVPYSVSQRIPILKAQMQMIKDLGFNGIRLMSLNISDRGYETGLYINYPDSGKYAYLDATQYPKIFHLLDSTLLLANEAGLKVIYYVGGTGIEKNEDNIEQFRQYLDTVAKHCANMPALMAYDLYNEPAINSTNLSKTEVFDAAWTWYRAIRDNTPNQLVTIGIHGVIDVPMWDPGILPYDFMSIHYYSRNGYWSDTVYTDACPNFKWLGENINKPWIIGETGMPADTIKWAYCNATYKNVADYIEFIKTVNSTNGSSGFSWWFYQDHKWFEGSQNLLIAENFYGLMNRRDTVQAKPWRTKTSNTNLPEVDGLRKFDSLTFINYNPGYSPPSSSMPANYYNVYGFTNSTCTGVVNGPGGPIKDAVVFGWKRMNHNSWKDSGPQPITLYTSYYTFTDANGRFEIKTDHPEVEHLCWIKISAPGKSINDCYSNTIPYNYDTVNLTNVTLSYGSYGGEFNDFVVHSGDTLVWNDPMSIPGNLIINNGGQLTVKNTVFFNTDKKITIEHGGKLIVDGGKLTSGCDDNTWQGIEVLNDNNYAQTKDYQGYVQLKNNAIIENAEIGIHCVELLYSPHDDGDEYYSGGIIEANGAIFRNNRTAIEIEPFKPNTSYNSVIENCTFEYNDTIVSEIELIYIKLTGVYGVNIITNSFNGNTGNAYNNRGTGIAAYDATFDLSDSEPPTSNDFNNMSYGIACYNTNGNTSPDISLTNFTDCWRAIYLSGVVDAKVLGDTIKYKSQSTTSEAYGIYLDNCDGYQVEGNILSASNLFGSFPENGIIINNSGNNANEIYRNTFEKIKIPLNAQNVNREYYGNTGLQLLCNNIINCTVNDIIVTYEEADTCNGIRQDQGKYTFPPIPAGNLFTYGSGSYLNYTNSSPHLVYYAHYDTATVIYYNSIPHYVKPKILSMNSKISLQNTFIPWSDTRWEYDCPPVNIGGGKSLETIGELKDLINKLQQKIDSANAMLNKKIDNSNTQQLINRINSCVASGYQALYNDLHKYSPYVSEKVLLALIYKQGFPTNFLINLMLKNTHVAKTYWLMDALKQIQPPLTTIQLEKIEDKYKEFSELELERMQLSYLVLQRDNAYNTIERFYAHDTLPKANDSLIRILEQDPRVTAKYYLVNQYFSLKDTVKANELINKIPKLYAFDANAKQDYEKYQLLFSIKKQLKKEGKTYSNMEEQHKQLLINAINNPSLSFSEMNSLNALRQVDEVPVGKTGNIRVKSQIPIYEEPILKPAENKEKELEDNEETKSEDLLLAGLMDKVLTEQFNLLLYPNPANEEVNILYNSGGEAGKLSIEISDVTGRIVGNYNIDPKNNIIQIKTQNYKKGIYYVILVADGKRMKVEKLVIQ